MVAPQIMSWQRFQNHSVEIRFYLDLVGTKIVAGMNSLSVAQRSSLLEPVVPLKQIPTFIP